MVDSATTFLAGEAGGREVAVFLKNPRLASSPQLADSGGTSGPLVQIIVTGNSVREDADIDTLVARISDKVEAALQRKLSTLGLRRL
jgi:hypothetical protein